LNSSKLAREIGQRLPAVSQSIEHLYQQHVSGFRERLLALAPDTAKG
jgi:hypothetical protein